MIKYTWGLAAIALIIWPHAVFAKECWALSNLKGQAAFSDEGYKFQNDGYSKPMVLCFAGEAGSVSGDDTTLMKFGDSTLAGAATNNGVVLFVNGGEIPGQRGGVKAGQ